MIVPSRRCFLETLAAAAAATACSPSGSSESDAVLREPYFPSAAHQFVWRNWDLRPPERIAGALEATVEQVQALGRSMGLRPALVDQQYASRTRFQVLRRNWYFAPLEQITVLLGIDKEQIDELLRHDAFYVGHLGPKPDCAPIRVEGEISGEATELFAIEPVADAEPRFAFIDNLSEPLGETFPQPAKPAFSPRIIFPYFAQHGDVLGEADFDSYYPDGILDRIARQGLSAVWVHVLLRSLVPSDVLPELPPPDPQRLARLRSLVERAARKGFDVYVYLNEPRGMDAAFFSQRPELQGAEGRPGEGLHALCTSTEPVRRYLEESSERLFTAVPDLKGAFLITASENLTNCYSLRRDTGCPRCRERSGPEVIGEVVRLIRDGARRAKPDAHIIAWDWSWTLVEDDPQSSTIAALPSDISLMVDYERGQPIERGGVESLVDEYSLSVVGPSPRAAAHLQQGRERGLSVMAKIQVGATWELALLPYLPLGPLVARKFASLRKNGVEGVMESWTLGTCPSPSWEVAQAFYSGPVPGIDEVLTRTATSIYGAAGAANAVAAWNIFSEAFAGYPFSNSVVYSSVVQCGPAHPIWLRPSGQSRKILHSFDTLSWTQPYGPERIAAIFAEMAKQWRRGLDLLAEAQRQAPESLRQEAKRDVRISQAVALYFESIANQVRIHTLRDRIGEADIRERLAGLVRSELELAERFLALCEADSRIGFEASLQYFFLPQDIREKIVACRHALAVDLA